MSHNLKSVIFVLLPYLIIHVRIQGYGSIASPSEAGLPRSAARFFEDVDVPGDAAALPHLDQWLRPVRLLAAHGHDPLLTLSLIHI